MKKKTLWVLETVTLIMLSILLGIITLPMLVQFMYMKDFRIDPSLIYIAWLLLCCFTASAFAIMTASFFLRKSKATAYFVLKYVLIANLCLLAVLFFLYEIPYWKQWSEFSRFYSLAGMVIAYILFEFAPIVASLVLTSIVVAKRNQVVVDEGSQEIDVQTQAAILLEMKRQEKVKKLKDKQEALQKKQEEIEKEIDSINNSGNKTEG